jgi:hypothetical protein
MCIFYTYSYFFCVIAVVNTLFLLFLLLLFVKNRFVVILINIIFYLYLQIAGDMEVPHDSWSRGTKTHVDRVFVYSINTKSSP